MKIVIVGSRQDGHGKVCLELCREAGAGEVVGFLDDNPARKGAVVSGVTVLGGMDALPELKAQGVSAAFVAIGDNACRQRLFRQLDAEGLQIPNFIHPTAYIGPGTQIGRGVFIGVNAVVIAGAAIGDFAIINTAATIDHDCRVGEAAFVGPGAHLAGRVVLEEGAFVGTGASVVPDIRIGAWSTLGAGGVAVSDVPPGATYVGVPARPIASHSTREEPHKNSLGSKVP